MSYIDATSAAFATKTANEIRNVCLIAHVDHGKTTFADSLVSTNSIISNRMAGKLRYLDSREDEQERGITMKSSGVSILFGPLLVNLIDSPGHVDFSSEVSSALSVSDVALLLVDVIEGVCSQTHTLMRQAIQNGQAVILVLNKLDRLKVELKLGPAEAYKHIARLLERVNSSLSQFISCAVLEDESWGDLEVLEQKVHFEPQKGNVLFASALHGYAFGLDEFADVWADKLKIDKAELSRHLFGDFYFGGGKIHTDAAIKAKKTCFEQLVLEPLWALHECALMDNNLAKTVELAAKLDISVKARRLPDAFDEIMRTWLPLPVACFRACARATSALNAFKEPRRLNSICDSGNSLRDAIQNCSIDGPLIAYVAKFITKENQHLAIIRILSGKLENGLSLNVCGRKGRTTETIKLTTTIEQIYFLRGRELVPIKVAVSGTVCAIKATNLARHATLSSEEIVEGLKVGIDMGEPLVRVIVATAELDRMSGLREALKVLTMLDSSLRVFEQENGELAMVTAGEVHLQKCLKDLDDMGYSELVVSAPIVPFMETIIPDQTFSNADIAKQIVEARLKGDVIYLKLRAVPLPDEIVATLEKAKDVLISLRKGIFNEDTLISLKEKLISQAMEILPAMKGTWWFKKSKDEIKSLFERIWAFGSSRARCNILFNAIEGYENRSLWNGSGSATRPLDNSICIGWELFCNAGPLCDEALCGVGIVVEAWTVDEQDSAAVGQLMTAMKSVCTAAVKKHPLRLVAAMYKCVICTASSALGKAHAVLAQRKAKVLSEDISESTGLFEIRANMPVVESFDFCATLRTRTSGMASGQLEFSHWQVIDEDPYWVPTTQEEIEDFGVKGDSPNHARGYMDAIRRRKGLPTEDLIVASAEKQRTLKKNK